jgi:LuxR family maltose regulon positive regulatory protein
MFEPFLRTKLYLPPQRPNLVTRPRLIDQLNQGPSLGRKLTLISAPAGFGKTTLVAEWIHQKDEGRGMKAEKSELPFFKSILAFVR